jgi:Fis family transcriptional regulator, factor for inversion stimulation protein
MKDALESITALMFNGGILYQEAVKEFKKRFILNALNSNWNHCKIAKKLGMHRNTLRRTIEALNLVRHQGVWMDCYEGMRRKENALAVKPAAMERRA